MKEQIVDQISKVMEQYLNPEQMKILRATLRAVSLEQTEVANRDFIALFLSAKVCISVETPRRFVEPVISRRMAFLSLVF